MKLAVFASGRVGFEIVKILAHREVVIDCLVVDDSDSSYSQKIIGISTCKKHHYWSVFSETETQNAMSKNCFDLGISAWWPHIFKGNTLSLFRIGIINTHPSLLPYNRGKFYFYWNIVERVPFGVTLHFIEKGIDSGDILFQRHIKTGWQDRGVDLWEKAQEELVALFDEKWDDIQTFNFVRRPQNLQEGSYHTPSEFADHVEIRLDQHVLARDLLNRLRGASGFNAFSPFFWDGEKKYKVEIRITEEMAQGD